MSEGWNAMSLGVGSARAKRKQVIFRKLFRLSALKWFLGTLTLVPKWQRKQDGNSSPGSKTVAAKLIVIWGCQFVGVFFLKTDSSI